MSQGLEQAREYEQLHGTAISEEERPLFHLTPQVGWMNDPNGFSWYQGQYHMFYQYYPYDSHWGPMHWGHAVSEDLLHWRWLPTALAPDMPYDSYGCFSGSAVTMPDGKQLLMYTGVRLEDPTARMKKEIQTQCLAFGDGVDYVKYEGNPILTEQDLPAGASRYDFRDPKVLVWPDGTYRALIASNQEGVGGQVLMFRSTDAVHWELIGPLAQNGYNIGLMWECPDFFRLDGCDVLLASAQDMLPKDFEYHNGNGSFYMLGQFHEETGQFEAFCDHATDYGIDFYAPQTVHSPDGRRIMIGWMQNWDTCNLRTKSTPWYGQMSLPRELSVRDGVLYQQPVKELEKLRRYAVTYGHVDVENEEISLPGIHGRVLDLEVEITAEGNDLRIFTLNFAMNDRYRSSLIFRPYESILQIDRKFSGSRRAIIHQRRAKITCRNNVLKLRLILDRYSVELFINDGEQVMSATLTTDLDAEEISFCADGKAVFRVTKYDLVC